MTELKYCAGCVDDFYNGKNPYGVAKCWNREKATMVTRILIHIDQPPPYKNMKPQQVPSCYRRQRFATVKPESLDANGYWVMA